MGGPAGPPVAECAAESPQGAFMRCGRFSNILLRVPPEGAVPQFEPIGGMRNPNSAVARSPLLRSVGSRCRAALEREAAVNAWVLEEVAGLAGRLGDKAFEGPSARLLDHLRQALRREFQVVTPLKEHAVFHYCLWDQLLWESADPETELPKWMRDGAPAGILHQIVPNGVFPLCAEETAAVKDSRALGASNTFDPKGHVNYATFDADGGMHAKAEVERLKAKGFVESFASWEDVQQRWPGAIASRVACLVKVRDDGSNKVRFVTDLRRSGVNGRCKFNERIVLPRFVDFANGAVDLMEANATGLSTITLGAVDFVDAFHNLHLKEDERGLIVLKGFGEWLVYTRLPFGLATAPLLWGRLAAAAGRLGQALFSAAELRLQIYVDDPAWAVAGPPETQILLTGLLLSFWCCLGLRCNWGKGQLGSSIEWIGVMAALEPFDGMPALRAHLSEKRMQEASELVDSLLGKVGMVDIRGVQRLAGLLAWIGGVIPWAKAFNSHLWAALLAHTSEAHRFTTGRKRPSHLFFIQRVSHALGWVKKLFVGLGFPNSLAGRTVQRRFPLKLRLSPEVWCVRTDASPFGMGGILFHTGRPVSWYAVPITEDDLRLLKAVRGESAWQPELELLAILVAFDAWLPGGRSQTWRLQADATAALGACARRAGRTPHMNALAAEIGLRLESVGVFLEQDHFRGDLNTECDALSRLEAGATVPPRLLSVPRLIPPPRDASFFWAWPREILEDALMRD